MREQDITLLERLKTAKVAKDDTDAIRKGLVALATKRGVEVPA